jgi:hypothetical protein
MPRPPVLPLIDWKAVFDSGQDYQSWIKNDESKENCERMEALLGEVKLEPHDEALLKAIARPVHAIAIAEAWCGDVVRHVPYLQKMAELCPNLRLRFIAREQHPDVFVRFLTNGGEAIPKFVFLSSELVECGNWGPMPDECRELIARGKACGDVGKAREKVAALYEADSNGRSVASQLLHLIDIAASSRP